MSRNIWKGNYRFLELGSGEELSHYHEIDLDQKMLENPLYEAVSYTHLTLPTNSRV